MEANRPLTYMRGSVRKTYGWIVGQLGGGSQTASRFPEAPEPQSGDNCEPGIRNALEIQMFGLRRSGNHAVIAWLAQQYSGPIVFLNNARPFQDPFKTYLMGRVPNAIPTRKLNDEETEDLRLRRKQLLLISYEDVGLQRIPKKDLVPDRDLCVGSSARLRRLLLLRDFYNWIASRIRLIENRGADQERILENAEHQVRLWLIYAREFVGETNYFGVSGSVSVNFSAWTDDEQYRSGVLSALGIPVVNNSRSVVPRAGGGSSFDGTLFSGKGEDMDLLSRWKHFQSEKYRPVLHLLEKRREEVDAYNRRIFGLEWPFGD